MSQPMSELRAIATSDDWAVAAMARIEAIPTLLKVLCESTGMRTAAVARVTADRWIVCAVHDEILFGLRPGDELPVDNTVCSRSRAAGAPILIEHASLDPSYRSHPALKQHRLESYLTAPIVLKDGSYFGNLCAFDSEPVKLELLRAPSMLKRFAALIGTQLDAQLALDKERAAVLDERASNELREQFIAILGHDLRNPLQAVYAMADLLQRTLVPLEQVEVAERIKTNARRMFDLIDDVLDFAKVRLGGGMSFELEDEDHLESKLNAVVRELQDAHGSRSIVSHIRVASAVRCDAGRIQQVASNLIANALTHGAPQWPVRFTADLRHDGLIIEVWNAGEPIAPESLQQIFQPFWRHTVADEDQGLGLGLYICAHIVRAHAGRISVTSSLKGGTRFIVRLPLHPEFPEGLDEVPSVSRGPSTASSC